MPTLSDLDDLGSLCKTDDAEQLGRFAAVCLSRGIAWPLPVVKQFLFDHGRNPCFVRQYGHLDLHELRWEELSLPAAEFVRASYDPELGQRTEAVMADLDYHLRVRRMIDAPGEWLTWKVPPLLIDGTLRNPPRVGLHLVEGHTRLGILKGQVSAGNVAPDSVHRVYVGQ